MSPSNPAWMNYDDTKLLLRFNTVQAAQRGTELHAFASEAIRLGIKLPKNNQTLNMYVNDAIGYRMHPEQPLFYSDLAFGTADAISFSKGMLRVHDLKTGVIKTSERQLEGYVALFCLEYDVKPHSIDMETRIYQSDERRVYNPDPDDMVHLMDKIVRFNRILQEHREEVMS
jgi:hypothetical protein